jgi:hypothetical protein
MDRDQGFLTGSVIGDERVLSIEELARACGAEPQWVIELVAVGVLEPQGAEVSLWRFRAADLTCARRDARSARSDRAIAGAPETGRAACGVSVAHREGRNTACSTSRSTQAATRFCLLPLRNKR